MIKPQHPRNIATTSQFTNQFKSRQQQHIDNVLDEYQNVFQEPNGVPLRCQVKHSIELVPSSSLPNTFVYRRTIIKNEEIQRQIQDSINKGHI